MQESGEELQRWDVSYHNQNAATTSKNNNMFNVGDDKNYHVISSDCCSSESEQFTRMLNLSSTNSQQLAGTFKHPYNFPPLNLNTQSILHPPLASSFQASQSPPYFHGVSILNSTFSISSTPPRQETNDHYIDPTLFNLTTIQNQPLSDTF